MRRLLILAGIVLILFLAMYSWNRRTNVLDDVAANVGLELSAAILSPVRSIQAFVGDFWERYFDLVDVRDENLRLKARLDEVEARMISMGEDLAELERLRALVQFPVDVRWRPLAARVLAGRLGPNAVLDTITISRGYLNGASPGVPLVTNLGLVGRVLRSSAHASTVLLVTDPGSHVAVFGQESRASGILKGNGTGQPMEVDFVQRDATLKKGEVLVTSGLDNKYPKGLPVALVASVAPSDYTQFMAVTATPLVNLQRLEEVLLLEKSGVEVPEEEFLGPPPVFVGPPVPPGLRRPKPDMEKPVLPTLIGPPKPAAAIAPAPGSGERQRNQPSATAPARRQAPVAPRKSNDTRFGGGDTGAPSYRIVTP